MFTSNFNTTGVSDLKRLNTSSGYQHYLSANLRTVLNSLPWRTIASNMDVEVRTTLLPGPEVDAATVAETAAEAGIRTTFDLLSSKGCQIPSDTGQSTVTIVAPWAEVTSYLKAEYSSRLQKRDPYTGQSYADSIAALSKAMDDLAQAKATLQSTVDTADRLFKSINDQKQRIIDLRAQEAKTNDNDARAQIDKQIAEIQESIDQNVADQSVVKEQIAEDDLTKRERESENEKKSGEAYAASEGMVNSRW